MSYFLVIYDRPAGRLREVREYGASERGVAYAERDRMEAAKEATVEVVLLQAASRADAERTHGRYFPLPVGPRRQRLIPDPGAGGGRTRRCDPAATRSADRAGVRPWYDPGRNPLDKRVGPSAKHRGGTFPYCGAEDQS